jgi:hypothetical protein
MENKETLEEAAERLYPVNNTGGMFMANRDEINNSLKQEGFIRGAKWQQERSYSEEDMRKAFIAGGNSCIEEDDVYGSAYKKYMEEWFEQFKKK